MVDSNMEGSSEEELRTSDELHVCDQRGDNGLLKLWIRVNEKLTGLPSLSLSHHT